MKRDLHTNQTSTALLCNANGVDAQETNSLCCAAAGVIAPLTATAEVLIPHEKLREAVPSDAALIAQNRPPAQPFIGGNTTNDWLQKIQTERISITWEHEGGCHVWRYWDSDEPCEKAYGNTIQEALEQLETSND
jgi:hypothetical protein